MSAALRVADCVLLMGTDKGYIECLKKDNYVTVWFIVGRNTEILPHNQCCQVPIVEWTGLQSGHLRNITNCDRNMTKSQTRSSHPGKFWQNVRTRKTIQEGRIAVKDYWRGRMAEEGREAQQEEGRLCCNLDTYYCKKGGWRGVSKSIGFR